jgi:2-haloacid dehalogenase
MAVERPDILKREIKVLAFDQYGTIVDMQKGLTEAVTPFLKRKGWDGEPNSFVTWRHRHAPTLAKSAWLTSKPP